MEFKILYEIHTILIDLFIDLGKNKTKICLLTQK